MLQLVDHLHFLDEMADVPVSEALLLEVFLDCHLLAEPAA